jgi:3-isopropylmalate/(R)-2-methylmalate dehydratase large subunit
VSIPPGREALVRSAGAGGDARRAGVRARERLDAVRAGDVVFPTPDLVVCIDMVFAAFVDEALEMGAEELAHADRTIVVCDHDVPNTTAAQAERAARNRAYAKRFGVRLYEFGRSGNNHILPVQEGLVGPGMMVFSVDTHSGNLGAVGAVAPCVLYDLTTVFATGTVWLKVPETLVVELVGELQPDVGVRDVTDHVLAVVGPDAAGYRAIEFVGPFVEALDVDGRMVLCNRPVEIGAKVAVVPPDRTTLDYVESRGWRGFEPVRSDPDATLAGRYRIDVGELEPQVAVPPSPDCVRPLSSVAGTKVTQALIQGCSSGTIGELEAAARVLAGRRVHPDVRMIVVPMTQAVFREAGERGLLAEFARAGAAVMPPSCQSCYGAATPLVAGDVCISTSPRNEPGRMGSAEAEIYLAGPATVAASAVACEIVAAGALAPVAP